MASGSLQVDCLDLRDFGVNHQGTVDDRPYGGGDGMVMRCEPLAAAVQAAAPTKVIGFSPSGTPWTQSHAQRMADSDGQTIAMVCGRFAGIDERFIEGYVDEEYSLGDFVISGGELAALVATDSIARLLPGGLGHPQGAVTDSFSPCFAGGLEYPLYTRPPQFEGRQVPPVLLSGDHGKISTWRHEMAVHRTRKLRPDLLS